MIETNRIALGSVQFGLNYGISNNNNYKPSINEVQAILDFAFENQINFLDTANAYGDAEQIIGALNNKRFNVITKFLPESQNGLFENQFNQSLDKLQAQSLYGLLAHRPMDVVKNPLIWKKMNAQKENLHVSKIGFSFENVEEYFAVIKKSFYPDLVQVPFNYFDDRFIAIIEDLKNKGCEIHTRSSFLQGLFFADTNLLPSFFADVKEIILNLQLTHDDTLAASLLKFVLDNSCVDKVVIGVQNKNQLQEILKSLYYAPILSRINKKIDSKILQPSLWPK